MLRHFYKNYTHSHNLQPIEIERTLILFLFLLAKFFPSFLCLYARRAYILWSMNVWIRVCPSSVMMVVRVSERTMYYYCYYYYYASWKTTLRSPGGTSSFIIIHAYTHIFPLNNIHLFYIIYPPLPIPYISKTSWLLSFCEKIWVN